MPTLKEIVTAARNRQPVPAEQLQWAVCTLALGVEQAERALGDLLRTTVPLAVPAVVPAEFPYNPHLVVVTQLALETQRQLQLAQAQTPPDPVTEVVPERVFPAGSVA